MRLFEISKNWVKQILDSMMLTVIDPKIPGARRSDCYAYCAMAIRSQNIPDDALFTIYGKGDKPAHGVIILGDNVIVDAFADGRVEFTGEMIKYNIDKFGMKLEPLNVVYQVSVGKFKEEVRKKYQDLVDNTRN